MSKVAIQGHSSGNGIFTIEAPNGNTNRTLVLPDEAGTVLTTAGVPASAMPAGSVIQVVNADITSTFSIPSSATSYTHATNHSLTLTTKLANSKILLFCNTPLQLGSNTEIGLSTFKSSLDSYSADLGETVQANYNDANSGWVQTTPLQYLHTPNQAANTAITYRVYIRKGNGTKSAYFPDGWGKTFSFSFMAMEIAA